jgi:hypothetical protein
MPAGIISPLSAEGAKLILSATLTAIRLLAGTPVMPAS